MKLHYRLGWLCALAFVRLFLGFRRRGTDLIPDEGPAIIASNHISNWDPVLVGLGCNREVHFMAKEELFRNPLLAWLIRAYNAVPVRRGTGDRRALRTAARILKENGVLIMFPGGTREESGDISDPKPGVGFIACTSQAPVVPAYITGSNRPMEALKRRRHLVVAFGSPLEPPASDARDDYRAFSAMIAERVAELKKEVEGS